MQGQFCPCIFSRACCILQRARFSSYAGISGCGNLACGKQKKSAIKCQIFTKGVISTCLSIEKALICSHAVLSSKYTISIAGDVSLKLSLRPSASTAKSPKTSKITMIVLKKESKNGRECIYRNIAVTSFSVCPFYFLSILLLQPSLPVHAKLSPQAISRNTVLLPAC